MDSMVKLAAAILGELAALERVRVVTPQIVFLVVLGMLALAAGGSALGCGMAALWIGLVPAIGPWAAPLVCGGVLLLAALILLATSYSLSRKRDRSKSTGGGITAAMESADVTALIGPLIREHKWLLIALATVAGMTAAGTDRSRKP
jgi:hypothetical protein